MSARDHNNSRPKKRNPHAKGLEDPIFRQQKIKSAKGYNRNNFNNFIEEAEDIMAEETFNPNEFSSICGDCVKEKGGGPGNSMASTHWTGTCSVCLRENQSCNDVWDWSWDGHTAPYWD